MGRVELAWVLHASSTVRLDWNGDVKLGEALDRLPVPLAGGPLIDGRRLDPDTRLDDVRWRRGAVLGAEDSPADPGLQPHLLVVGGPLAGTVVQLTDVAVVTQSVVVTMQGKQVDVAPVAGADVRLEGEPLTALRRWVAGDVVQVGSTLLTWSPASPASSSRSPLGEGLVGYARAPRILPSPEPAELTVPTPPRPPERRALPLMVALAPLAIGVVLFYVTESLYALLFSLLSPVLLFASWLSDRRTGVARYRAAVDEYDEQVRRVDRQLAETVETEATARRGRTPDPATSLVRAIGPRAGLWERRRTDPDHLDLTVGTADLPSSTRLRGDTERPQPLVPYVPMSISMRELGVVGVCGDRAEALGIARWWVGQTAASSSPRDVRLVVLSLLPSAVADWGWARWLPHTNVAMTGASLVAVDEATVRARLDELASVVRQRRAAQGDGPDAIVVLDGAGALRTHPSAAQVLDEGPPFGVRVICIDDDAERLPEECRAVVACDGTGWVSLRTTGAPDVTSVLAHQVSAEWTARLAHALAPLRDTTPVSGSQGVVPATARLLEVLELEPPTPAEIARRWAGGATSRAVIGVGSTGPVALDLHADGPHALVAGTTGAGKSELLQTWVASLAAVNRPDRMTFLLVDYKGGAAFAGCARLPHTVGLVTDLDAGLTARALESLTAELRRRESMLGVVGAKDLDAYVQSGSRGGALARLVIVVDEFATLVEELPDFVRGVVGIAQRGRSLGIHLVLATQRPSGVVSPEIRANTNLRIALRVTDVAESADVIDAPDAARIERALPGRAFARAGHDDLRAFQTARVGGPAQVRPPPAAHEKRSLEVTVVDLGAPAAAPAARAFEVASDSTDLDLLVAAIDAAAADLGAPSTPPPWLPPLPRTLAWSALPTREGWALEDRPAAQRQPAATLGEGHLLVAGAARSGRTTLLRTLAVALASSRGADDLHLYAVDGGNGPLSDLAELPHTGAVVAATDTVRVDRLLTRLAAEVRRRQDGGAADEPDIVLLVDRWESFAGRFDDLDNGRLLDLLLDLVRDGLSVGLRVVTTGDRSLLLGRLPGLVPDVVCLRLADVGDYGLAGLDPRRVSADLPPGRGYRAPSGVELQVAFASDDELRAVVEAAAPASTHPALRIDPLPKLVSDADADLLPWTGSGRVLVGVGGDELARVGVDLALVGPGFVVAGPRRSGRSTALLAMARSAVLDGSVVVAIAPRGGPLVSLSEAVAGAPAGRMTVLTGLGEGTGADATTVVSALQAAGGQRLVVLVDDAELLKDLDVAPVLADILRQVDQAHALVVATTADDLSRAVRGYLNDVRASRSGLLLTPENHLVGDLLGVRLPRSAAFRVPVGRALLVVDGQVTMVQVPVPDVVIEG